MKNALINAILSQKLKVSKTVKIGGVQCFVRQATIASQKEIEKQTEKQTDEKEKQTDENSQLKIFALILCDEKGELIFDKDNSEDLSILENLTAETIAKIVDDYAIFNGFRQPETEKEKKQ